MNKIIKDRIRNIYEDIQDKTIVQDLKKLDHVIVMITCGLSSLLFFDAPFKSYIIISPIIALFVAALVLRLKK